MSKKQLLKAYPDFAILSNYQLKLLDKLYKMRPHWLNDYTIYTDLYHRETRLKFEFVSDIQRVASITFENGRITIHFDITHMHITPHWVKTESESSRLEASISRMIQCVENVTSEEWLICKRNMWDKSLS